MSYAVTDVIRGCRSCKARRQVPAPGLANFLVATGKSYGILTRTAGRQAYEIRSVGHKRCVSGFGGRTSGERTTVPAQPRIRTSAAMQLHLAFREAALERDAQAQLNLTPTVWLDVVDLSKCRSNVA